MKFAGVVYILLTIYVIFYTKEKPLQDVLPRLHSPETKKDDEAKVVVQYEDGDVVSTENTTGVLYVYRCFIDILRLDSVQTLAIIHLTSKFAFQCNEAATNLKLLEQGFKREDLAVTVLIDVPFEIIFGYYVAKWSSDSHHRNADRGSIRKEKSSWINWLVGSPGVLTPWMWGYLGRLSSAVLGSCVVKNFPKDGKIGKSYFTMVVIQHLSSSFMSTVQFVGMSAFHTRVADPLVGGTYMTLLNTLSNFGGTWPKLIIMSMINYFTIYECKIPGQSQSLTYQGGDMNKCTKEMGGSASIIRDGYYVTNAICYIFGLCLYFGFLKKKAQQLQNLPISSWRCE